MEHTCNWGCYVDKYGVDHHALGADYAVNPAVTR